MTKLVSGAAIGQFVLLLASPILTRLYSPAEFGQLALFVSFAAVLFEVVTLRYHFALPLARTERHAFATFVLCWASLLATLIVLSALALSFSGMLGGWFGIEHPQVFFLLLLLTLLIQGANVIFQYWAMRGRRFGVIARSRVIQALATAFCQVGLGWVVSGGSGLLIGQVAGQASGNVALIVSSRKTLRSASVGFRWKTVPLMALRYRNFPQFNTWSALANALSMQLPVIILMAAFGPVVTGLFSLGQRMLQTPVGMVSGAVGQVFYASAAQAPIPELRRTSVALLRQLSVVALPILLWAGVVAPPLFTWVFGAEWTDAGQVFRVLAPWVFLMLLTSPLSSVPTVLGRQRTEMWFQFSLLLARAAALLFGWALGDVRIALLGFVGVSVLWLIGLLAWIFSLVEQPFWPVLKLLGGTALRSILLMSPAWAGLVVDAVSGGSYGSPIGMVIAMLLIAGHSIRVLRKH